MWETAQRDRAHGTHGTYQAGAEGPPGGGEEESTAGCVPQLPQVLVTEPEARLAGGGGGG